MVLEVPGWRSRMEAEGGESPVEERIAPGRRGPSRALPSFRKFLEEEIKTDRGPFTFEGREALRQAVESTEGLTVDSTRTLRYERTATPEQLREQAENAHYSTFSLYGPEEFAEALQIFLRRLPDPLVRWCDENLLLICERRPSTHT